jgi:hypothetical protein
MFRAAPPPRGPGGTPCCQDAQTVFTGLANALAGVWYALAAVWSALLALAARWRSLARCARAWAAHSVTAAASGVYNSRTLAPARDAWAKAASSQALQHARAATASAYAAASARATALSAAAAPHLAAAAPFAPHAGAAAALLAFLVYSPPVLLARLAQRVTGVAFDCSAFAPPGGARRRPRRKFVALTIDDGPCPFTTGHIINVLRTHGARATMFVVGSHVEEIDRLGADGAALGRQTLKNIVAAGHELGNHTM